MLTPRLGRHACGQCTPPRTASATRSPAEQVAADQEANNMETRARAPRDSGARAWRTVPAHRQWADHGHQQREAPLCTPEHGCGAQITYHHGASSATRTKPLHVVDEDGRHQQHLTGIAIDHGVAGK